MLTSRASVKSQSIELYVKMALATIITALAGWIAVQESQAYYFVAPFHFDSATYINHAMKLFDIVNAKGRLFAAQYAIQSHQDSLDVVLRILLAPSCLQTLYGHMAVTLPFMALFNFLLIHYVYKRTRLWVASLLPASFLFCFPLIYSPYLGIADYWKESIAIWILGSAVLSWLLSNMLTKPQWSLLCGTLLGLLVMERTALSVYTALMFLPLVLWIFYQRLRNDDTRTALFRIGLFVFPALLLCSLVAITQWQILYNYYFKVGYAYASPLLVAKRLLGMILKYDYSRFPTCLAIILYALCFYLIADWKRVRRDILISLWFVISLPLVIMVARGLYIEFFNAWTILLVVLLATLIPKNSKIIFKNYRILLATLLGIIVCCSAIQQNISSIQTKNLIQKNAAWRIFYEQLAETILSQPKPCYFCFLFAEDYVRFLDHVTLNQGVLLKEIIPVGFMSTHDTYYTLEYAHYKFQSKFDDIKEIAEENIRKLEKRENTLVVTYCDSKDIPLSPAFENDGSKKAMPILAWQSDYLRNSLHWQAIKKLNSPYGCLYIYKYSKIPLTDSVKWQAIA